MSILNVDKIQPIGGGSTITVDATDIQASTGTIRASTFSGDVSATGIGVTSLNITGVTTSAGIVQAAQFKLLDNAKAKYGTGEDLEIYHNATNSLIQNGTGSLQIVTTTGDLFLRGQDNITFNTAGNNERLRIDSNGRVVIGHTQASTNYGKLLHIHNSASAGASLHLTDSTTGTSNSDGFEIVTHSQAAYLVQRENSHMIFMTNGTNERLRIDSSGRLAFGGVSNNSSYDTNAQNILLANESGNFGITIRSGGSDPYAMIHFADGTSNANETRAGRIYYQHSANTMIFATANTERFRITGGGQVLIGTTTVPAYTNRRLTVFDSTNSGTCSLEIRGSSSGSSRLYFTSSTTAGQLGAYAGKVYYGHADNVMAFYTAGDERLRILSDGRVYIGATSGGNGDTDDLVISGSGKKGITLCSTDGSESRLTFADGLSGVSAVAGSILYTHSNDSMDFNTSTTRRLRISGSGPHLFLGGITSVNEITETSTNSGLVIGNTSMGNGGLAIINSTSGTGRIYFGDATGSDAARNRGQINYYHSTDSMEFATSRAVRLRIDSSGNITKPNNPSFRAYLTGSTQTANANADIIYQNTGGSHGSHNIGGHYNTSNGRFTAPVAGRYVFIMMHIPYGNYSNNATYISVNGVNKSAQHFSYTHGNLWSGVTNTAVLNLSAGDYVTTKFSQQTTIYGTQWGTFNGYLLS